jgi:hypothetical protein
MASWAWGVEMKETPTILLETKDRENGSRETPTISIKKQLLSTRYPTISMKELKLAS